MNTPHKHAELIKKWADGAVIQMFDRGSWTDLNQQGITWYHMNEYRIKPEVTTSLSNSKLYEVYVSAYRAGPDDTLYSQVHHAVRAVADAAIKQYISEQGK